MAPKQKPWQGRCRTYPQRGGWRLRFYSGGRHLYGPQRSERAAADGDVAYVHTAESEDDARELLNRLLGTTAPCHSNGAVGAGASASASATPAKEDQNSGCKLYGPRREDTVAADHDLARVPSATSEDEALKLLNRFRGDSAAAMGNRLEQLVARRDGHTYFKAVHEEFGAATADGQKFFECFVRRNIFKKLAPGDLLILVQTRSHGQALVACEIAYPAVSREQQRPTLYDRVPDHLRQALDAYLDGGAAFDRVFDLRGCNMSVAEVLAQGGYEINPKTNLGLGVVAASKTHTSGIGRLRDFLQGHAACIELPDAEAIDIW